MEDFVSHLDHLPRFVNNPNLSIPEDLAQYLRRLLHLAQNLFLCENANAEILVIERALRTIKERTVRLQRQRDEEQLKSQALAMDVEMCKRRIEEVTGKQDLPKLSDSHTDTLTNLRSMDLHCPPTFSSSRSTQSMPHERHGSAVSHDHVMPLTLRRETANKPTPMLIRRKKPVFDIFAPPSTSCKSSKPNQRSRRIVDSSKLVSKSKAPRPVYPSLSDEESDLDTSVPARLKHDELILSSHQMLLEKRKEGTYTQVQVASKRCVSSEVEGFDDNEDDEDFLPGE